MSYVLKFIRDATGKALYAILPDGSLFGRIQASDVLKVLTGKKKSASLRFRDELNEWKTVGWLNGTKKSVCNVKRPDTQLMCWVPNKVLTSLIDGSLKEWHAYMGGK